MRRTSLLALLVLTGFAPADATAQSRCPKGASCQTVTVPLDRSGAVAGTVGLRVAVRKARSAKGAPVMVLAGGPGQANVANWGGWVWDLGAKVMAERDVIAFDPRGTGRSGALNCPAMQRTVIPRDTAAAEACAVRLGERRRFYTTIDQAEDIEAVRAQLGVDKLTLYGISYGTKVAQTYARLHPDRVESLVLDSIVDADGMSALSQEILGAMPRVLGDDLDLVTELVNSVRTKPAVGVAIDERGKRHRTTAYPASIFDVLLAADFNPAARQVLPSAIEAVQNGDPAPLMRIIRSAQQTERLPPRASIFSAGLYAATSCQEIAFPWSPDAPPSERIRTAREAAAKAPSLAPFNADDVLTLDWVPLCLRWPNTPGPRPLPAAMPDVPALLLSGRADLRTPVEEARKVQGQLPRSRLLTIHGVGHSVVGTDPRRCARRALRAFLRGTAVPRTCPRAKTGYEGGAPVPPRSINRLRPLDAPGRAGRTVRAIVDTIQDSFLALQLSPTGDAAGGLRAGYVRYHPRELIRLHGYEYVPGVRVTIRGRRVTVTGRSAARGTLRLTGGRLVGTLGGRRVSARLY